MNELEKAEAYDKAVEKARQEYNTTENVERKQWLEEIFPQLRENKDKKIRKALIERITEIDLEESVKGSGFYAGDYDGEEICNWLERQGDKDKLIKELGEYKVKYTQEVLSQQLENQNKIDKVSYEVAEKEKYDFVSGKFIKCIKSFDVFKEDNSYWLEYVGNDTYIGRSDNILNQKFHITPRQLYSLFVQENCPKEDNANAPTGYGKYVDECLNEASEHFFSEGEDKYSVADLFYAGVRCGKSWYENQNAVACNVVDSSEDDKIMKGLIKGLSAMRDIHHRQTFSDDAININDAIDWLEKQAADIDINQSEFEMRLNKLLKQFESLPKEDIVSSLSFYLNVIKNDGTYIADEKQCKKISKLDIDDMVEKYKQEQFPLHNSSTSSHSPYYPIGYIDNMIAQYRKGINDTLNLILRK